LATASQAGDIRIAPVIALPAVLTELGVKPQRAFTKAGVDIGLFQDPEGRIAFEALGRLLKTCVELTQCAHFGLLLGERFDLTNLGQLGYLMRNAPTVGAALRSLLMHLHLYDRGAAPVLLAPEPDCVILGYSIYRHATPASDQIYDGAILIGCRIMRELCGPSWRPLHAHFAHGQPESIDAYRRLFRSSVSFDAGVSGIKFPSSVLQWPIEGADATLHGFLTKAILEANANGPMSFAERVEAALHQMVLSNTASTDAVAHLFGISERTLRRKLKDEGKNLMQLINSVRFELARQLLDNTDLPISEIATALQYADQNAFSRAFRRWAALSPSQWRMRRSPAG
jgi:AraC-like DNA-binding protein